MKNLIKFFNAAPINGKKLDEARVIEEGAKRGYLVHPDCCTQEVLNFLESETFNPNSTFYKTWKDITDKTRFELFIDQIKHYSSTIGTNYEGEVYCPNGEPISINYKLYTVIRAVTTEELYRMCLDCLEAGAALAEDTLNSITSYVIKCVKEDGLGIDLDKIANRDAQCILSEELGIFPTTGAAIIRVLFYKVFGNPMPIQSRANLNKLLGRQGGRPTADVSKVDLTQLTQQQLEALSTVFLRYKKFMLGLKRNLKNAPVINKLRRMAVKNHKPMEIGFWENFTNLDRKYVAAHLDEELAKLDNNFKITRLIQMIDFRRLQNTYKLQRIYTIRNGKLWVDRDSIAPYAQWWDNVREALVLRLVENLKATRERYRSPQGDLLVKFDKRLELACPVSEKKFLGNIPFGSRFDLTGENNYFGVYWRNEWGTRDYDIHYVGDHGEHLGWNGSYKYSTSNRIVFSGDMTTADPEATEMFYIDGSQRVPDGILTLNRFNGYEGSKWRLFFGQEKIKMLTKNYMVDPNTIKLSEMGESTANKQLIGRLEDNKLMVCVADVSGSIVSRFDVDFNAAYKAQAKSYLMLKDVLLAAGFTEYTEEHYKAGKLPQLDLTDLRKDTLLNLFA